MGTNNNPTKENPNYSPRSPRSAVLTCVESTPRARSMGSLSQRTKATQLVYGMSNFDLNRDGRMSLFLLSLFSIGLVIPLLLTTNPLACFYFCISCYAVGSLGKLASEEHREFGHKYRWLLRFIVVAPVLAATLLLYRERHDFPRGIVLWLSTVGLSTVFLTRSHSGWIDQQFEAITKDCTEADGLPKPDGTSFSSAR